MKIIYVIQGSTGEYSDHREWNVAAYYSEMAAQAHVQHATLRANELLAEHGHYSLPDGANEHDKGMQCDYSGVRYSYSPVDILD